MEYVVIIDERGRLVLPSEVRKRLGIEGRSRVLIRVKGDGTVELYPLNKLYEEVSRVFEEKFNGWKEEAHEASKLLSSLLKAGDSRGNS
ncbi:MAG: AbrB/MazE/SpoVT family DNA-binding domain-containing protein [Candidatus Njordarchaeales archaeon]